MPECAARRHSNDRDAAAGASAARLAASRLRAARSPLADSTGTYKSPATGRRCCCCTEPDRRRTRGPTCCRNSPNARPWSHPTCRGTRTRRGRPWLRSRCRGSPRISTRCSSRCRSRPSRSSPDTPPARRWRCGGRWRPRDRRARSSAATRRSCRRRRFIRACFIHVAARHAIARLAGRAYATRGPVARLDALDDPVRATHRYARLFRDPAHLRGTMGSWRAQDLPGSLDPPAEWPFRRRSSSARGPVGAAAAAAPVIARRFAAATVLCREGGHLLHEVDPARAAALLREALSQAAARAA